MLHLKTGSLLGRPTGAGSLCAGRRGGAEFVPSRARAVASGVEEREDKNAAPRVAPSHTGVRGYGGAGSRVPAGVPGAMSSSMSDLLERLVPDSEDAEHDSNNDCITEGGSLSLSEPTQQLLHDEPSAAGTQIP